MTHLIRGLATFGAAFCLVGVTAFVVSNGANPTFAAVMEAAFCGVVAAVVSKAEES